MYRISRQQIINFLVNCHGYIESSFCNMTKQDLIDTFLEETSDQIACEEYNMIGSF